MKKFLRAMILAALFAACTVTAYASSSELEGYPVTVSDWDTPQQSSRQEKTGPSPPGTSMPGMVLCWGVSPTRR